MESRSPCWPRSAGPSSPSAAAPRGVLDDLLQLMTFADRVVLKRLAGRSAERERRQGAALRAVLAAAPRPRL